MPAGGHSDKEKYMKAAVLRAVNTPLKIEDLEVDAPGSREVMVKVKAVGLCHLEVHVYKGLMPAPLPTTLGHEGAGIVEEVGPEVKGLKKGDPVVFFIAPSCNRCDMCLSGKPWRCRKTEISRRTGGLLDGTSRLHTRSGENIHQLWGQGSMAEYVVVDDTNAIKIRGDAPLDKACLLSCGASTGIGTVVNVAAARPGDSIAIFGCGGVGMAAIMGAKMAGAYPIIAVDIAEEKLQYAKQLGASCVINSKKTDPVKEIMKATDSFGVKYAIEAVGSAALARQAIDSVGDDGTFIQVGGTPMGEMLEIDPGTLFRKTLTGSSGGRVVPAVDIPKYLQLYMCGQLPLDRLISRTYTLGEINKAIDDLANGRILGRSVILI
jgi:S-(hydroxymethyl)glutathione dehydrogenase / alcohol dehydrogenase